MTRDRMNYPMIFFSLQNLCLMLRSYGILQDKQGNKLYRVKVGDRIFTRHIDQLFERIVTPALNGKLAPAAATTWLKNGCTAALSDDEGRKLKDVLDQGPPIEATTVNQPPLEIPPVTA